MRISMTSLATRALLALASMLLAHAPSVLHAQATEVAPTTEVAERQKPAGSNLTGLTFTGFGQVFASYDYTSTEAEDFNAFNLRRAELGLGLRKEDRAGFLVNIEAVRSAGPRSYFGVDNNSLVMRVKHGFGFYAPRLGPGRLTIRGGMIPDVWVETVEQGYDIRAIAPVMAEEGDFYVSSDLGGSVGYVLWDGFLEARLGLTNGEGRNQFELNTGKNTTAVLSVRPLRFDLRGEGATLGVHASYRDGSLGTSSRANHRVSAALTFAHPRHFGGAEFTQANGFQGQSSLQARGVSAWANSELYPSWLGAYARFSRVQQDIATQGSDITRVQAGLYADLIEPANAERSIFGFPRLRLYAGYTREQFGENAEAITGVDGASDAHIISATLSARGAAAIDAGPGATSSEP